MITNPQPRTRRWISSSIPESEWSSSDLARLASADYHVNNFVSPVLFREALQHIPDNAIVIEIAPHCLLQAVLRQGLSSSCSIVGLMDKRQPDNMNHLMATLGKYVDHYCLIFVLIAICRPQIFVSMRNGYCSCSGVRSGPCLAHHGRGRVSQNTYELSFEAKYFG